MLIIFLETKKYLKESSINYNAINYITINYNTVNYNTINYNTINYNTINYNELASLKKKTKKGQQRVLMKNKSILTYNSLPKKQKHTCNSYQISL